MTSKKSTTVIALLGAMALVLAGCVGNGSPNAEPSFTEKEAVEGAFNSLVDPSGLQNTQLEQFVAKGSAAEQEIKALDSRIGRGVDEGILNRADIVITPIMTRVPDSEGLIVSEITLCFDPPRNPELKDEDFCFIFSSFEFESGLVHDFVTTGDGIRGHVLLKYFTAVGAPQPDQVLEAKRYAVGGSLAEAYAIHQSHTTQADVDTGQTSLYASDVTFDDGILYVDYSSPFSEFIFEGYRLSSFKAGDSTLDGRIAIYDEPAVPVGDEASVKLLSAYVSIMGATILALEITAGEETLQMPYSALYQPTDGRTLSAALSTAPWDLNDGRISNAYWSFAVRSIGGELRLVFQDERFNDLPVTITVPNP